MGCQRWKERKGLNSKCCVSEQGWRLWSYGTESPAFLFAYLPGFHRTWGGCSPELLGRNIFVPGSAETPVTLGDSRAETPYPPKFTSAAKLQTRGGTPSEIRGKSSGLARKGGVSGPPGRSLRPTPFPPIDGKFLVRGGTSPEFPPGISSPEFPPGISAWKFYPRKFRPEHQKVPAQFRP